MVVAFVAVGTAVTGVGTQAIVTSPAGAVDDLLVFLLGHDDYSDGVWTPASPPLTMTTIDSNQQRGDDSRANAIIAKEDQAGARAFTFDITASEEFSGICMRFSGQHLTTPYTADSRVISAGVGAAKTIEPNFPGGMALYYYHSDSASGDTTSNDSDWTHRAQASRQNSTITCWSQPVTADFYPFNNSKTFKQSGDPFSTTNNGYAVQSTSWVINPAETTATISGITKDKDGTALGSCKTALFKRIASGNVQFVEEVTSNASTGAYSFTLTNDVEAKFFVYSFKDDTPHVMDATDHVLTPS